MKANRNEYHRELCERSIDFLFSRVEEYLNNLDCPNRWYLDHKKWLEGPDFSEENGKQIIDVILFGSFLRRYFEIGSWPEAQYRFWCVSPQVKRVLCEQLGIPDNAISAIPRYDLITKAPERAFDLSLDHIDLVYAGRLSPVKNIESVIYTAYWLQKDHQLNTQLHLFGAFDNETTVDKGRREADENYQETINKLIDQLDWNLAPIVHGEVGSEEWIKSDLKNPTLINLSTYMCEDFSVSSAQAQEAGWPQIISNWGGLKDVTGDNILKLHPLWIGETHNHPALIKYKARIVAKKIISGKEKEETKFVNSYVPNPISVSELDKIRRKLVASTNLTALFINREQTDLFADTKEGGVFFQNYHIKFGKSLEIPYKVIIVFDRNYYGKDDQDKIIANISEDLPTISVPIREIFYKENLRLLSQAKEVIPVIDLEEHQKVKVLLKNLAGQ